MKVLQTNPSIGVQNFPDSPGSNSNSRPKCTVRNSANRQAYLCITTTLWATVVPSQRNNLILKTDPRTEECKTNERVSIGNKRKPFSMSATAETWLNQKKKIFDTSIWTWARLKLYKQTSYEAIRKIIRDANKIKMKKESTHKIWRRT